MSTTAAAPLAINALIWISLKPVIKLSVTVLGGFVLTRSGLFPPEASKGASQLILNCTLPALLFSKIVVSFTPDNIQVIGPIIIIALFYIGTSLVFGFIVRSLFPVPRNFRSGILAAAGFSNWGDLPTSVTATVTLSYPFSGQADSNLAIAYVSIFILVFFVTMFPLQGTKLISRDYTDPFIEPISLSTSPTTWKSRFSEVLRRRRRNEEDLNENDQNKEGSRGGGNNTMLAPLDRITTTRSIISVREFAAAAAASVEDADRSQRRNVGQRRNRQSGFPEESEDEKSDGVEMTLVNEGRVQSRSRRIRDFTIALFSPPTIALISALIIALVPRIKSLFYLDPTSTFQPTAPDGQPPLAVLLDATSFLGAASVPLGLIVLGSALARMRIPRPWSKLPIGSIVGLAVSKLIILPVIGYFLVHGMARYGFIDGHNQVLVFVCIYFSVVPTSTTQVALTQIYCDDGESNEGILASYLIFQYCIFVFSSVILTAIVINGFV